MNCKICGQVLIVFESGRFQKCPTPYQDPTGQAGEHYSFSTRKTAAYKVQEFCALYDLWLFKIERHNGSKELHVYKIGSIRGNGEEIYKIIGDIPLDRFVLLSELDLHDKLEKYQLLQ